VLVAVSVGLAELRCTLRIVLADLDGDYASRKLETAGNRTFISDHVGEYKAAQKALKQKAKEAGKETRSAGQAELTGGSAGTA
jgi:hypothetical protein